MVHPIRRAGLLMLSLTLLGAGWSVLGQARAPYDLDLAAAYDNTPGKQKLRLAMRIDARAGLVGDLKVVVLDDGKEVVKHTQPGQAIAPGKNTVSFELPLEPSPTAKRTVRVEYLDLRKDIPLADILYAKGHETVLQGGQDFYAGSRASLACGVKAIKSISTSVPHVGAEVRVALRDTKENKTHDLGVAKTDAQGNATVDFTIPELVAGSHYALIVTTKSPLGSDVNQHNITVKADGKILLVTDKPIYQPGQLIHLRALCLQSFSTRPLANKDLLFEIEDSKGNKVFKRTIKTSDFGIASIDFQLADEVIMGDYNLRAILGEARAEKTVQVKRYVLPKFKVNVTTDKTFYLPKETIKAELQSDYFFGKAVAKSKVEVVASTFDVAFKEFHKFTGTTDEQGHVKFEIKLPDYFVGQPLQSGNALVKLDVKVIDTADHAEKLVKNLTVSEQPIKVSLLAEGGKIAPGLENRIFAAAIYPDGSPAPNCDINVWLGKESKEMLAKERPVAQLKTNKSGLAELKVKVDAKQLRQKGFGQRQVEMLGGEQPGWGPEHVLDLFIQAKDPRGNQAKSDVELNSHSFGDNVLVRLDKAIYQAGDRMTVDVRSSAGLPTAYVDIVRGGQIMLSKWVEVKNGAAQVTLDVPPTVFGSLEIHAYQMLNSGEIVRDSRVAYVQSKTDLKIDVKNSRAEYAPGEEARLRFVVTDSAGKPTQAALGVIVVDEAVYALQDLQPGLEKVYFTLQEELLKPQVQLKFSPGERIDNLILQPVVPLPQQQVAEVLLTAVKLPAPKRWNVDPGLGRKQHAQSIVHTIGSNVYGFAFNRPVLEVNPKTKAVEFRPDLFEAMLKSTHMHPTQLVGPFGEKLTVADVQKLAPGFKADKLAYAVTAQRMFQLFHHVGALANQEQANRLKNGKWSLDSTLLAKAAKQIGFEAKDIWGSPLRLVMPGRVVKEMPLPKGHVLLAFELISAGPDGVFGTADDLNGDDTQVIQRVGWMGQFWWMNDEDRLAMAQPRQGRVPMRERFMQLQRNEMRFRRDGMVPPPGPPGMPVPGGIGGGGPGGPVAMPAMAVPLMENKAAMAMDHAATGAPGKSAPAGNAAPITKIREYFPETMLWQPNLITDDQGVADLAVSFADSITTWRLNASANAANGLLGNTTMPLKVFQDFFVDIDIPVSLTQSDEVSMPVAVYNYLKTPQTVKLELQQEPWFKLIDDKGLTRSLDLKPGEVTGVSFRIKADKIGFQPLTVKAFGSKKSDAVKRLVEVVPNGQKIERTVSDRLQGKVAQTIQIPADAVPDASKVLVRVYPGVMAQVMEGAEGILRLPGGCFEQTSSSAYPNVLVVDYIKKARISSPKILMTAENYLNVGYQRLLTFERPGGGFDWWGREEPLVWLSAYGLQEFADMAKVYPIDRGIIDRTQAFLMKKMDKDHTWSNIGATHGETIASMGNAKLLLTSYVVWSLLESGYDKKALTPSIVFIKNNIGAAGDNAYMLALACNALAAYDPKDASTLDAIRALEKLRKELGEWKAVCYEAKATSLTYGRGDAVTVEATALAALAMLKTGQFTNNVNQALTYLIKVKGNGHWGSTQATILALKALVAGMGGANVTEAHPFTISVNGKEVARGKVDPSNADIMQTFDLAAFTKSGDNQVEINMKGETGLMYQILSRHFEPWAKEKPEPKKPVVEVDVTYDRTKLSTNDLLRAKATLKYHGPVPTFNVIVDLGIAPGFTVDAGDFAEMVAAKKVAKFTVTARQVTLYIGDVKPGDVLSFEYALRPKFPLRAQAPGATAWEYYTPANRAESRPVEITVEEKK